MSTREPAASGRAGACRGRAAAAAVLGAAVLGAAVLVLGPAAPVSAQTQGPNHGRPATAAEIAGWDISIPPSGEGLPPGSGDAVAGARIYAAKCQVCHGERGAGQPNDRLVGGQGTLASGSPVRTVGSYWPYATTLFDYTRRAMPYQSPLSLSSDEVYALTAYLLHLNGIIAEGDVMDARSLPRVKMPNRDNFLWVYPARPR